MSETDRPPSSPPRTRRIPPSRPSRPPGPGATTLEDLIADLRKLRPEEIADVHADACRLLCKLDVRAVVIDLERIAPAYDRRGVPLWVLRMSSPIKRPRAELDQLLRDAEARGLVRLASADPSSGLVFEPNDGIPDSTRGLLYYVETPERPPRVTVEDLIDVLRKLSPGELDELHDGARMLRQARESAADPMLAKQIAAEVHQLRRAYNYAPGVPLSALRLAFSQPRTIFDRSLLHAEARGKLGLAPLDLSAPFVAPTAALWDELRGPLYYATTPATTTAPTKATPPL